MALNIKAPDLQVGGALVQDGSIHRHRYRLITRSLALDTLEAFSGIDGWHGHLHGWRFAFRAQGG